MPSAFDTDVMTPSGFRNTQTYGDAYIRQHTTDNLPTPPGFEPDN